MAYNFENRKNASAGGKKSKRGANKINLDLVEGIEKALNPDKLITIMDELEGFQYVQAFTSLLKYRLPTMRQIDLDANVTNKPMDAIDKILQMSDDQINKLYPDDDQIK